MKWAKWLVFGMLVFSVSCKKCESRIEAKRAQEESKNRDYDEAIRRYTSAIKLDPKFAIAYNSRCSAYIEKSDYKKAINDCNRAIQLEPKMAEAYYNRCNAYLRLKQYMEAIEDCSKAIEMKPSDWGAYKHRGIAFEKVGDIEGAVNDYKKVVVFGPEDKETFAKISHCYYKTEKFQIAWEYLNRAKELGFHGEDNFVVELEKRFGEKK